MRLGLHQFLVENHSGSGGIFPGKVGIERTERLPGVCQILLRVWPTMFLADNAASKK